METTLEKLVSLANAIGERPDYTQGGGGNVSYKDDAGMFVKASGLRLSELRDQSHFVTIDHQAVRVWHQQADHRISLETLIRENDAAVKRSIVSNGTARPSIETGFHALLGQTVLHTHSVYVNTLMCAHEGEHLLRELFPESVFIPYRTPGVALSLAIHQAEKTPGSDAIFLENHGLIIVANTPEEAFLKHESVNTKIKQALPLLQTYPTITLTEHEQGWQSSSEDLCLQISDQPETIRSFIKNVLFPDQVVYGDMISYDLSRPDKVTIDTTRGHILYNCGPKEALAIEETLAAWLYIYTSIVNNGLTIKTLDETEGSFIANLDSEKYRKSIL